MRAANRTVVRGIALQRRWLRVTKVVQRRDPSAWNIVRKHIASSARTSLATAGGNLAPLIAHVHGGPPADMIYRLTTRLKYAPMLLVKATTLINMLPNNNAFSAAARGIIAAASTLDQRASRSQPPSSGCGSRRRGVLPRKRQRAAHLASLAPPLRLGVPRAL